jgi:hypothetical protein
MFVHRGDVVAWSTVRTRERGCLKTGAGGVDYFCDSEVQGQVRLFAHINANPPSTCRCFLPLSNPAPKKQRHRQGGFRLGSRTTREPYGADSTVAPHFEHTTMSLKFMWANSLFDLDLESSSHTNRTYQ